MSKTYKIYRWDPVILGDTTIPFPVIYIKPTEDLLQFAKNNNNILLTKIHTTDNDIYNNKKIIGIFIESLKIPNCRPNFFKKTGLYCICLISEWYGYPSCLGECSLYGFKNN